MIDGVLRVLLIGSSAVNVPVALATGSLVYGLFAVLFALATTLVGLARGSSTRNQNALHR